MRRGSAFPIAQETPREEFGAVWSSEGASVSTMVLEVLHMDPCPSVTFGRAKREKIISFSARHIL